MHNRAVSVFPVVAGCRYAVAHYAEKAKNFVPEQPQAQNDGSPFGGTPFDGSPFEETATKQEKPVDKVFDEFDL